jgi:hypothetical protein
MSALLCSSCSVASKIVEHLCQQDDEIARLDVRQGREVLLSAGVCWEISRPIYYEVRENGKIVVPKSYMDGDSGSEEHHYEAIFSEGGSLVGVLDTTNGKRTLVVMQNFRTGDSWPRVKDWEVSYEEHVVRRNLDLFDRLRKDNPSLERPDGLGDLNHTAPNPCSCCDR